MAARWAGCVCVVCVCTSGVCVRVVCMYCASDCFDLPAWLCVRHTSSLLPSCSCLDTFLAVQGDKGGQAPSKDNAAGLGGDADQGGGF